MICALNEFKNITFLTLLHFEVGGTRSRETNKNPVAFKKIKTLALKLLCVCNNRVALKKVK